MPDPMNPFADRGRAMSKQELQDALRSPGGVLVQPRLNNRNLMPRRLASGTYVLQRKIPPQP